MPHISGSDLTARSALTPNAAAELALSFVGAAICPGVPDVLTRKEREVVLSRRHANRAFPAFSRVSCTELGAWPITGLVSVVDAAYTQMSWVTRFDLHLPTDLLTLRNAATIRFVTGYAEGELPAPLKAAVVELGSRLLEGDLDIKSMSWDTGLRADYVGATDELLPKRVRELIAPWTFQGFG